MFRIPLLSIQATYSNGHWFVDIIRLQDEVCNHTLHFENSELQRVIVADLAREIVLILGRCDEENRIISSPDYVLSTSSCTLKGFFCHMDSVAGKPSAIIRFREVIGTPLSLLKYPSDQDENLTRKSEEFVPIILDDVVLPMMNMVATLRLQATNSFLDPRLHKTLEAVEQTCAHMIDLSKQVREQNPRLNPDHKGVLLLEMS